MSAPDPARPSPSRGSAVGTPPDDEPIRGDLLSPERLVELAQSLAATHQVSRRPGRGRRLLARLEENGRVLLACYRDIARAIAQARPISPAAEWLADNFHIIEDQLREVRDDLPPGFYRQLPKLREGFLAGSPRVYALAWAFIEHTDSRIDVETLRRFVAAYQEVHPLTIGELWAVAISLRLVLVENLRRLAERIVQRRVAREEADALADAIVEGDPEAPAALESRLLSREEGPLPSAFIVQLLARLRDQDPDETPALQKIDERLTLEGLNRDEVVLTEHRYQVAMHVSVRNVITSMRLMSALDWTDFFESVSLVEEALREGTQVAAMDFPTRDRYRHAVEELARGSQVSELEIARRAAARARDSGDPPGTRRADPGFYLISRGRAELEKDVGFRATFSQWLRRAWVAGATPGYLTTISLLTLLVLTLPLVVSFREGGGSLEILLMALLALVPASELAIAVINQDVTELVGPRRLPKLDLRKGIPGELSTIVAVPTLLTTEEEVRSEIEQLEVRFLANSEGIIRFALLSDWKDASSETASDDEALLASARHEIAELNRHHGPAPDGGARFLLFHRRRVWNPSEGLWMGWERKRGKLHEFNRLLRGAADTTFLPGGDSLPAGIRYVITLDADTRLPRDAVHRLVGAMAHALNRPVFDARAGRVVEGHGILQPRITAMLPAVGEGSVFQRVFSGPRGIDPYAFAVSDVYQDLFGEGIYTGKGIYDVDAFEQSLAGRVPENALLSHDLFEGIFARAGLATDVELFEDFPSHYEVAAARHHRWTRGDWQLLPWLLPRVPDRAGGRIRNPIPAIGRWKILDNLRRSLFSPAALATLFAAWILPHARPVVWTGFILATFVVPRLYPILIAAIPKRRRISKRSLLRGIGSDLLLAASHVALSVTLLAHQAWLMSDAIVRTVARVIFFRRRFLEWVTAAQARSNYNLDPVGFYARMAPAVGIAAAALLPLFFPRAESAVEEVVFFIVWAFSPMIAWAISRPPATAEREPLSAAEERVLRLTARRTWRFFESFIDEQDHRLPPDNYQEEPRPVIARRTSPTNIGLYLLSVAAAHDLGWIGANEMAERLELTMSTMEKLARFRGHFYNWYDTRTLSPLEPQYVSTVDSGNLAAHLIAVKHACLECAERPCDPDSAFAGIADAVALTREAADALAIEETATRGAGRELAPALRELENLLNVLRREERPGSRLSELARPADTLADIAEALAHETRDAASEDLALWARAVKLAISSHLRDGAVLSGSGEPAAVRNPGPEPVPSSVIVFSGAGGGEATAGSLSRRFAALARTARRLVDEMEFGFLYDSVQRLFSIGYLVEDGRLDPGYYDLLASEARLASFLAIAQGQVPASHWFRLGRPLTPVGQGSALVSWSGSMFEYLMPDLVMDVPTGSLLDLSTRLVVARQIQYGAEHRVPWGISESAYNARDVNLNYQYSSFGVTGLGLKRGLAEDLVIAPYATALAAMVDPSAAARNFRALSRAGGRGAYGYYEAIDYTRSRLPENASKAVVKAYMAHHEGMTIVALGNVLSGWKMRRRFHSEPMVQATELLLQERTPRGVGVSRPRAEEVGSRLHVRDFVLPVLRRFRSPHDPTPRVHLLSNGRYAVMTTSAGSGYSRCQEIAVTRWREDPTRDPWGSYVFLRDVQSGKVWSAAYQPSAVEPDSYDVAYYEDRVEIRRRDGSVSTALEIVVSAEDDAELRQVSISNLGVRAREIEVTSYAELVLNEPGAESAHPVFSNLFVETEFVPGLDALVATRRPRSAEERRVWAAHLAVAEGFSPGAVQYETDRGRFLGRARDLRIAAAVQDGRPLSNTVGPVLDPIFSLRRRVRITPGGSARITFSTVIASSREELLTLADKYRDPATFERTVNLAWTQAQVQLRHLQITADEAHLFQRLATRILYSDPTLRAPSEVLQKNVRGPSALWPYRISGDHPIVFVRVDQPEDRDLVRQLLSAQEYWRMKGLAVDLVILNEEASSYNSEVQSSLETVLRSSSGGQDVPGRGGVFLLKADQVSAETRDTLAAAARIVLVSRNGSLTDQVLRFLKRPPSPRPPRALPPSAPTAEAPVPRPSLQFFNGIGGFSEDGNEYVTILGQGQTTPAPWINVIANPSFGFQVSESGSGFTWSGNSRENQLTCWSNDPVSDPPSEALYVRDEETGEVWTPTALPIREDWPYVARHGQGYTRFEHESHGIALDLLQFVAPDDPVKISGLSLENRSPRRRRLSVTGYVEWLLAPPRSASGPFVVTWMDPETGALCARNPWNEEFGSRVAFAALGTPPSAFTADRGEFLGRNGSLAAPAGLAPEAALSGRTGAGLDPCAALQTTLSLAPGERTEILFLLGQETDRESARRLVLRYRAENPALLLREVRRRWEDVLGALQVRTPDASLDLMLNRWLLYQALGCRIWARSAFYQAGGAYGFRDQLQDALALAVSRREILRDQILLSASRQFLEGDVQHWWHPPSGRGVRTRISDDLLWLPYSVTHYLDATGDATILDVQVPFLEAEPLKPDEMERYFQPQVSSESATLFEHCARALEHSLPVGQHGLPLFGTGDWNDGMNRVGAGGRGESVWLGWFLHTNLWEFAKLAEARGETDRARRWREHVAALKAALERDGWDGDWYRRGFFDDGTPLGSASNEECRIDSIAQSWGVISGAAEPSRARRAMSAVEEYLVRRGDGLVLLFTPPFDRTALDPGYIRGYPPGVRENGGQYTHAALWSTIAFAALGEGDKAGELFSILNPINHAGSRAGVYRYKVEPYVAAADIYSQNPHVGRGGWTWYTGSAGWMYRAGIEWILGFRLRGAIVELDPCIPRAWPRFQITFRYHSSRYLVTVENPNGVARGIADIRIDGRALPPGDRQISLADDGAVHRIDVLLG